MRIFFGAISNRIVSTYHGACHIVPCNALCANILLLTCLQPRLLFSYNYRKFFVLKTNDRLPKFASINANYICRRRLIFSGCKSFTFHFLSSFCCFFSPSVLPSDGKLGLYFNLGSIFQASQCVVVRLCVRTKTRFCVFSVYKGPC